MKLKLHGLSKLVTDLNKTLGRLAEDLPQQYAAIVDEANKKIAASAVANLDKPGWLLSKAIGDKTKLYREGKFVFGVTEVLGGKSAPPNTPGAYGFYQEHGWHVDPKTVRRPQKGNILRRPRKETAYRRQPGKKFFERSFQTHQRFLVQKIEEFNRIALTLDLKATPKVGRPKK